MAILVSCFSPQMSPPGRTGKLGLCAKVSMELSKTIKTDLSYEFKKTQPVKKSTIALGFTDTIL